MKRLLRDDFDGAPTGHPVGLRRVPRDYTHFLPHPDVEDALRDESKAQLVSEYSLSSVCVLEGELDSGALEAAFRGVVAANEILQGTFEFVDGRPCLTFASDGAVDFGEQDRATDPSIPLDVLALEEAAKPFDILGGPLMRVRVTDLGSSRHLLAISVHHFACDTWSWRILMDQLCGFYDPDGERAERGPNGNSTLQYVDYLYWYRSWLRGRAERCSAFWRSYLDGFERVHAGPSPSWDGDDVPISIPPQVLGPLRAICLATKVSMYMLLTTCIAMVLCSQWPRKEVLFCTQFAGRPTQDTWRIFGYFLQNFFLRIGASPDEPVLDLLQGTRERTLTALSHVGLPYREMLSLVEDPAEIVGFNLLDAAQPTVALKGLHAERVRFRRTTTERNLYFQLCLPNAIPGRCAQDESAIGFLAYNKARYGEGGARKIVDALEGLLRSLPSDPSLSCSTALS